MRLKSLSTTRLADPQLERVRREQVEAIAELQRAVLDIDARSAPGRWQFVHRETLRSSERGISIGGLDGDADGEYLLRGRVTVSGTGGTFDLWINGEPGSRSSRLRQISTTVAGVTSSTAIEIAPGSAPGTVRVISTFEGTFYARSGAPRHYEGRGTEWPTAIEQWLVVGEWTDQETNVQSLGVVHTAADLEAGSWFEIYRRAA